MFQNWIITTFLLLLNHFEVEAGPQNQLQLQITSVNHEEQFFTTPDFQLKLQVFTMQFNISAAFDRWYFKVC